MDRTLPAMGILQVQKLGFWCGLQSAQSSSLQDYVTLQTYSETTKSTKTQLKPNSFPSELLILGTPSVSSADLQVHAEEY